MDLFGAILRGGPGSGNHGHAGRPGEVGGSAPGDGPSDPIEQTAFRHQGKITPSGTIHDPSVLGKGVYDHTTEAGFLTHDGKFITRTEAAQLVLGKERAGDNYHLDSTQVPLIQQVVRHKVAKENRSVSLVADGKQAKIRDISVLDEETQEPKKVQLVVNPSKDDIQSLLNPTGKTPEKSQFVRTLKTPSGVVYAWHGGNAIHAEVGFALGLNASEMEQGSDGFDVRNGKLTSWMNVVEIKSNPLIGAILKGDWSEEDHPRESDGKFTDYGGGGESVKLYRGGGSGSYFTNDPAEAAGYAHMQKLIEVIDSDDELGEIAYEVLAEGGGESLTDLSSGTLEDIISGNSEHELPKFENTDVHEYEIRPGKALDLTHFGSVVDLESDWNDLHKLKLVDESWDEIDDDYKQEMKDKYDQKSTYFLFENEGVYARAFELGYDAVQFHDEGSSGKSGHRTWIVRDHEKQSTLIKSNPLIGAIIKGGDGSGNFGHAGRPGEVGGSAPSDSPAIHTGDAPTVGETRLVGYHFSREDRTVIGLKREYAGTAAAGSEANQLIRDVSGKVQPDAASIYVYLPGARVEDNVAKVASVTHRITFPKLRVLSVHSAAFHNLKTLAEANVLSHKSTFPSIASEINILAKNSGFEAIVDENRGVASLLIDVPPQNIQREDFGIQDFYERLPVESNVDSRRNLPLRMRGTWIARSNRAELHPVENLKQLEQEFAVVKEQIDREVMNRYKAEVRYSRAKDAPPDVQDRARDEYVDAYVEIRKNVGVKETKDWFDLKIAGMSPETKLFWMAKEPNSRIKFVANNIISKIDPSLSDTISQTAANIIHAEAQSGRAPDPSTWSIPDPPVFGSLFQEANPQDKIKIWAEYVLKTQGYSKTDSELRYLQNLMDTPGARRALAPVIQTAIPKLLEDADRRIHDVQSFGDYWFIPSSMRIQYEDHVTKAALEKWNTNTVTYQGEVLPDQVQAKLHWINRVQKEELTMPERLDPMSERGQHTVKESWDTSTAVEDDQRNYERTRSLVNGLKRTRFDTAIAQRASDQGLAPQTRMALSKLKDNPQVSEWLYNEIEDRLWNGWKSSSTSRDGQLLRWAVDQELGGRSRFSDQDWRHINEAIGSLADRAGDFELMKPVVAGQPGSEIKIRDVLFGNANVEATHGREIAATLVRAYVRATWEASQWAMARQGIDHVVVYRAVFLPTDMVENTEKTKINMPAPGTAVAQSTYFQRKNDERDYEHPILTQLPQVNLKKHSAQSTTLDRTVANHWEGVFDTKTPEINAGNTTRVVLRIKVPRAAVVSLPSMGKNMQGEREIILAGTHWDAWDAWAGHAPDFADLEIK